MHHALEIEELLLNIFSHCCPATLCAEQRKIAAPDLATLARTCRLFKEPALDVLWSVLILDLSPLARCLPEASCRLPPATTYSFSRSLTHADCCILQSYTRRVRSIRNFKFGLDRKAIAILSDPPTSVTLFPNLRELQCVYTKKTKALLRFPLPSLVSLDVQFASLQLFRTSLDSLPKFSPNTSRLSLTVHHLVPTACRQVEASHMSRWQNLRSVMCPELTFDVDALVHLSHMPALTQLSFWPSSVVQTFDSPLRFLSLRELTLQCHSLESISRLLSCIQLSITSLTVCINDCPSRQHLASFLDSIRVSGAGHTIQSMMLNQSPSFPRFSSPSRPHSLSLGFEDLLPCMTFSSLRYLQLDIGWNVGLTDGALLKLVSAWPQLQRLQINAKWGWNMEGGITPGGFIALLQTCRSLGHIALALDLRGYTQCPPGQVPGRIARTLCGPLFVLDVLDSVIERDCVPAVATFLSGVLSGVANAYVDFSIVFWNGPYMVKTPSSTDHYIHRWNEVYDTVLPGLDFWTVALG